ncbi:zinc finger CCCH domain-containing protein 43-like isoform X1 [Amaranthus tricolor]|uniref:zinc finger CCCH domain-containing protein 43-like isoform X1 n=1 Tax=Amaranthus tricolor TaxID=29722 RepID=UPI00258D3F06|nr:zinc finger CCCH domain-containing protein 43-like isoform X1 [Amaranthus tricolor]
MGTCEVISSSLETQDEIQSGISILSNGTHHEDHQPTEVEILAKQLESVVLQAIIKIEEEEEEEEDEEQEEEEEGKSHIYPLRPYATDCSFYMKTGSCKFGQSCRFNHPTERAFQPVQDQEKGTDENYGATVVDTGKIDCKYFRTPGGCRYGDSCRYNHPTQISENEGPELNFLGLPVRPSEVECTFYMRTGSCGYGANCRFHHPDPSAAKESQPRNSFPNGAYVRGGNNLSGMYPGDTMQASGISRGITDLSNGISSLNGLPYSGINYHQAMSPNAGWNQPKAQLNLKTHLPHQMVNISKKQDPSMLYEQVMQSEEFPVRLGQPDCDYFMRTGDCKYRAACRYNHPVNRSSKLQLPLLSTNSPYTKSKNSDFLGLTSGNIRRNGPTSLQLQQMPNGQYPERPGQPECEFFMKTGNCKFKSACRFHHPKDRISSPSALNQTGLPLRPGSKICRNYELQGTCKYGRNCLFDHPDNTSSAVSVGSANGEDYQPSNPVIAADLEPSKSDWGDDWVM